MCVMSSHVFWSPVYASIFLGAPARGTQEEFSFFFPRFFCGSCLDLLSREGTRVGSHRKIAFFYFDAHKYSCRILTPRRSSAWDSGCFLQTSWCNANPQFGSPGKAPLACLSQYRKVLVVGSFLHVGLCAKGHVGMVPGWNMFDIM